MNPKKVKEKIWKTIIILLFLIGTENKKAEKEK